MDNNNNEQDMPMWKIFSGIGLFVTVAALLFAFSGPNPEQVNKTTAVPSGKMTPSSGIKKEIEGGKAPKERKYTDPETTRLHPSEEELKGFIKYQYKFKYKIPVNGKIDELVFTMPLPYDEKAKQYVSYSYYNPKPSNVYLKDGNLFAEYKFTNVQNSSREVYIDGDVALRTYDLQTAKYLNRNTDKETVLNKYLLPEKYIESGDKEIIKAAKKIGGNSKEEIIKNIYEYVNQTLTYNINPGLYGAKKALLSKKGKCSEYAALMVALCRAKGIPARVVTGHIIKDKDTKHTWVEVYFDEYGWVTFDPTKLPTVVNIYENGRLIQQQRKQEYDLCRHLYLALVKDGFFHWDIDMTLDNGFSGVSPVAETFVLKKMK